VHHLLSNYEYYYFLELDWSLLVTDIREQFPLLPLEETLDIASELGVRHPTHLSRDRKTALYTVMTTDFLVTLEGQDAESQLRARTVKPRNELDRLSVIGKFEIERRYWQARGIDWHIVTEREINFTLARNIEILHNYRDVKDRLPLAAEEIRELSSVLTSKVATAEANPLRHVALACDKQLGYQLGTSLAVAYHLLANRIWRVDMNILISPTTPLALLSTDETWLRG
jgi:hypothetical protein